MKSISLSLLLISSISPAFGAISLFDGTPQTTIYTAPITGGTTWQTTNYSVAGVNTNRTVLIFVDSAVSGLPLVASVGDGLGTQNLIISNPNGNSQTASVIFGEFGAPAMNLNLGAVGNAFQFTHASSDLVNSAVVNMTFKSNGVQYTSPSYALTQSGTPNTVFNIPFSAFSAGANFADVDSFTLKVKAISSADITITNFQVVPEPTGITLLSIGLGACVLRRRRR